MTASRFVTQFQRFDSNFQIRFSNYHSKPDQPYQVDVLDEFNPPKEMDNIIKEREKVLNVLKFVLISTSMKIFGSTLAL